MLGLVPSDTDLLSREGLADEEHSVLPGHLAGWSDDSYSILRSVLRLSQRTRIASVRLEVDVLGTLIAERFMRPQVIVNVYEAIEATLLFIEGDTRQLPSVLFESAMNSFVASVFRRLTGTNALCRNA